MNTTRRSFLGAAVAILASAVSGFTGKYREDSDTFATGEGVAAMPKGQYVPVGGTFDQRFPKTARWAAEQGWDVCQVEDRSGWLFLHPVIGEHGQVYDLRVYVSGPMYDRPRRTLAPTCDEYMLRQLQFQARKVWEAWVREVYGEQTLAEWAPRYPWPRTVSV